MRIAVHIRLLWLILLGLPLLPSTLLRAQDGIELPELWGEDEGEEDDEENGEDSDGKKKKKKDLKKYDFKRWHFGYRQRGRHFNSQLPAPIMLDSWVPIHFVLTNNTKNDLQGTLSISVDDARRGTKSGLETTNPVMVKHATTFQRPVLIPGHKSTHHIVMHAYISRRIVDRNNNYPIFNKEGACNLNLTVSLSSYGIPLRDATLPVRGYLRDYKEPFGERRVHNELLLVFSDSLQFGAYPANLIPKERPNRNSINRFRQIAEADPEYFDTHWIGYSGVSTILFDDIDLKKMDPVRSAAIRNYVAAGGQLVIAVGQNRQSVLDSFLLPILPCGLGEMTTMNLDRVILNRDDDKEQTITVLAPKPGARVLELGQGMPLAVAGDYGSGRVTVLAFSLQRSGFIPSRMSPARYRQAWQRWIDPILSRNVDPLQRQDDQSVRIAAHNFLQKQAARSLPKRSHMALLLLVYLILLVPGCWLVFSRMERLEYAWLITPLIAIGFFWGSYYMAFRNLESNLAITDISLMRIGQEGRCGGLTISLIHNPTYKRYTLAFEEPEATPLYLRADWLPGIPAQKHYRLNMKNPLKHFIMDRVLVPFNDMRFFESTTVQTCGRGLPVRLDRDFLRHARAPSSTVVGRADNRLGFPLQAAALLYGETGFLLRRIDHGDDKPLAIDTDVHGREGMTIEQVLMQLCSRTGAARMAEDNENLEGDDRMILQAANLLAQNAGRVMLLGVVPRSMAHWTVHGKRARNHGFTVFAVACDPVEARVSFPVSNLAAGKNPEELDSSGMGW